MDQKIQRVVAPDVVAAERIVEREGKIQHRPAGDRQAAAGRHERREQMADGRVPGNRLQVVEDERPGKAVGVDGERGQDQAGAGEDGRPAGGAGLRGGGRKAGRRGQPIRHGSTVHMSDSGPAGQRDVARDRDFGRC